MLDTLIAEMHTLCDEPPLHTGWYPKDLRTGEAAHRRHPAHRPAVPDVLRRVES
jgi:hypothetical protein